MCHITRGRWSVLLLVSALARVPIASGADVSELDQFEEKCVAQTVERALKAGKSERALWLKGLEAVYPGKVAAAHTEEEYETWFDLLVGKNEDWKRDDAPNPQITELFDKVTQRLELGPVPTIRRAEFRKYARHLHKQNPPEGTPDPNEDTDKAFRALDRNGDGELDRDEFSTGLRDDKRSDADGNGRISKDEYRNYFRKKVALKTDALEKSGDPARGPGGKPGKPGAALPDWFAALDENKDGQVSLFEWRTGGRATTAFQEMDLNGDGLLTRDEYLRYVRLKDIDEAQKKREENPPQNPPGF